MNLVMELENANINGYNIAIKTLHLMILFYSKNIENQVNYRTSKFILG